MKICVLAVLVCITVPIIGMETGSSLLSEIDKLPSATDLKMLFEQKNVHEIVRTVATFPERAQQQLCDGTHHCTVIDYLPSSPMHLIEKRWLTTPFMMAIEKDATGTILQCLIEQEKQHNPALDLNKKVIVFTKRRKILKRNTLGITTSNGEESYHQREKTLLDIAIAQHHVPAVSILLSAGVDLAKGPQKARKQFDKLGDYIENFTVKSFFGDESIINELTKLQIILLLLNEKQPGTSKQEDILRVADLRARLNALPYNLCTLL